MTRINDLELGVDAERQLEVQLSVQPPSRALVLLDLVARERRRILQFVVFGLIVSTAVAFLIPARYEATARLMPPDQSGGMTATMLGALAAKAGDGIGSMATDLLGMRTSGATLVGILSSRTVQDDLINKFDLRKVYYKKKYDSARKVLQERTSIGEDRKSGIITIQVQDRDPDRAAMIAGGYVNELNARVSQLTTSSAHRERVFLENRLQSVKLQLDDATLQLSRFSSKNKTLDPQIEGKTMLEAAANLQGQLIAAEAELSGLEQIYGPENSRVRAASAKVGELRSKLLSLSGNKPQPDGSVEGQSGQLYPSLTQLPMLGNTYYGLARQAKIDEAVYEALTKQYELAKVEEAKEIPTIKVLDEPVVPERKAWPPRTLIIALGTLLAFCLGIAWLALRDTWNTLDPANPYKLAIGKVRVILSSDPRNARQRLAS
jgi:uncharacterized protein involved in exopolysaccharide biosynthesis